MTNVNELNFELCNHLLEADSEMEIVSILGSMGYWNDKSVWANFDNNENNYSTIGAQQAKPAAALVEKLINSIDAVLLRECYLRGILPESKSAPKSIEEALETFFNIKNGNLALISSTERTKLSENIGFIATGSKSKPSYIIFDKGEGQTPNRIQDTFLSLNKSNKLRIPFVQGKFNMGGTGVLRFCGEENLQLIISKRHPLINSGDDIISTHWGFTLVRRENPSEGRKSSIYTYLAPGGKILSFQKKNIQIPTKTAGTQIINPLEWGSIIKLYEYDISPASLKTNILFDLYNYISLLTPKIGLPVRFYERRKQYTGKSFETTMSGLHVRLEDDRNDNIEDEYPTFVGLNNISGQNFRVSIYAFREGKAEKYRKDEGILFTLNGQTQGHIPISFFTRSSVGLSYLANSILLIVNCDEVNARTREKLFMNTRDRLSEGELKIKIERELERELKNHPGLRLLQEERRRKALEGRLSDSKPLIDVIDELIRKSPLLQSLFIKGYDISNPFKSKLVGETKSFNGKPHPTYFELMDGQQDRDCHINQRFRVQFETDVANDYFIRDRYPGKFEFNLDGNNHPEYVYNLLNGVFTLTVSLPETVKVGDELLGNACVSDETLIQPFCCEFSRNVKGEIEISGGEGGRKPPAGNKKGNRKSPDNLALPQIKDVKEEEWQKEGFDKFSALKVVNTGTGTYDFYINVDNIYLKTEIKSHNNLEVASLLTAKFRYGLVLFGMALLKDKEYLESDDGKYEIGQEAYISVEEVVKITSRSIAPIILPMIEILGKLSDEEILHSTSIEIEK